MKLDLIRKEFSANVTIGDFLIDGVRFSFSLEDTVRPDGIKIPKQTAIPYGTYEVIIDLSQRFKLLMPHILNVPMFEGIRIHNGSYPTDTDGCVLIGYNRTTNYIFGSKRAFNDFFPILENGLKEGKVFINITKGE